MSLKINMEQYQNPYSEEGDPACKIMLDWINYYEASRTPMKDETPPQNFGAMQGIIWYLELCRTSNQVKK